VQEQGDFGFWSQVDGKPIKYPHLTQELIAEVFDQRILNASMYTLAKDADMAFTAKMVLSTLMAVRDELNGRMV
jgi:hypothetical protein